MVGSDTRWPRFTLHHREVGSHFSLLRKSWLLSLMTWNFSRCNFGLEFGCGAKALYTVEKAGAEISIVIGALFDSLFF